MYYQNLATWVATPWVRNFMGVSTTMTVPDPHADFWIFGYGSLIWNPGFPYAEVAAARIYGFHRRLCVLSTIYRGTPEKPGLLLGLERSGSCTGRAFRVCAQHVNETLSYLDEREQVTKVYCPHFARTRLSDGRIVQSYTFVVRHEHEQYAGKLSIDEQARLIAQGVGERGSSLDYMINTIKHMNELGITDTPLHRVLEKALKL